MQTLQRTASITLEDVVAISKAVLYNDHDGYTYCRLCQVNQDREAPAHDENCPVAKLAAEVL